MTNSVNYLGFSTLLPGKKSYVFLEGLLYMKFEKPQWMALSFSIRPTTDFSRRTLSNMQGCSIHLDIEQHWA